MQQQRPGCDWIGGQEEGKTSDSWLKESLVSQSLIGNQLLGRCAEEDSWQELTEDLQLAEYPRPSFDCPERGTIGCRVVGL